MNTRGYIVQEICWVNPNEKLTIESMKQAHIRFIENHHELWKELFGLEGYTSWLGDNITNKTLPSGYSMVLIKAEPCGKNILLICEDTETWSEEELFNKFQSWPGADVLDIKPSE